MKAPTGSALNQWINAQPVPAGSLALWSLGEAGFVLKGGETIAYIDPYLTNYVDEHGFAPPGTYARRFPPPLKPEETTNVDVIFCTHEHMDHTDPKTVSAMAQASPDATFVGPANCRDMLLQAGIPKASIVVPEVDKKQALAGLTYVALPSAHYGLDYDEGCGFRWLGFVIEISGVTLYHAGDTILYDGLIERVKRHSIDIAILPANGRDWWREQRGAIGNLHASEVAEFTAAVDAEVLLPMHNNLFVDNRISPAVLAEYLDRYYPWQKYHWLQPGELYYYVRGFR